MNNHTVKQLNAIAKERGMRGYYKHRKVELIYALEATRLVGQKSIFFDGPIPNDPTPVLQPTSCFFTMGMQKIKDYGEWLLNYIPPKPKVVDKVLESFKKKIYEKRYTLFQPTQFKTALKNFAIQYRVKGPNGFDP